jgi:replicative DNA helicase
MYWDEKEKPKAWDSQPFEVNIAKNRHGPTGVVTLQWYASNGRFTDKGVNSWL